MFRKKTLDEEKLEKCVINEATEVAETALKIFENSQKLIKFYKTFIDTTVPASFFYITIDLSKKLDYAFVKVTYYNNDNADKKFVENIKEYLLHIGEKDIPYFSSISVRAYPCYDYDKIDDFIERYISSREHSDIKYLLQDFGAEVNSADYARLVRLYENTVISAFTGKPIQEPQETKILSRTIMSGNSIKLDEYDCIESCAENFKFEETLYK